MVRLSPPETVTVDDVGDCQAWSEQSCKPRIADTHLTAGGFAAMGVGVCGVPGGRLARPDAPCVMFRGDGSSTMAPHALTTALEYDLPCIWMVRNNDAIGCIRDLQHACLEGRELASSVVHEGSGQFWNPDFAAVARAMGVEGLRVEHPDPFADACAGALRSGRPTMLDIAPARGQAPASGQALAPRDGDGPAPLPLDA